MGAKGFTRELLQTLLIAFVLALLIRTFLFESFQVEGVSMRPTLHTGERVLVNKVIYDFEKPRVGQIVVFRSPVIPSQDWIKRIIGVPGDTVMVRDNIVYINGKRYPEPFVRHAASPPVGPITIRPGYLWVEGDNRPQSYDSRYFGPLPMRDVKGQAFLIWWPLNDVRWLG
ncbi:Signal peptidase I [Candidatus Hydrogenisulfobacillus filiaventi]|uniref:Signal peptidase I n=1 Tax=Candidatus Hydrogenisulfobacillus filiaventi TaxID=2707344 RepID=A0A6F8ZHF2_9FIRM|nr:signal peptidase I [Bacillota bacterium]CAB1129082.1 Signal peptidase I [Candidatus Hydrogenisulfobacillus filiaventi]